MKKENRNAFDELSSNWKFIAAVIAAVGVITAFVVDLFGVPVEKVMPAVAFLGLIIIVLVWYVSKEEEYTRRELEKHKKESNEVVNDINNTMKNINDIVKDTRKDTVRIQLLLYIERQPENIDTILKLAEVYFIQLEGDWYMTNEFMKWARSQDVIVPLNIMEIISKER